MSYKQFKRIVDLFLAVFLGIIFLPISLLVALAIKFESPGGPIFADTPPRVGKGNRRFKLFKFRSMFPGAHDKIRRDPAMRKLYEEYKKHNFKLNHDPRVTKVGRFIRRYSLDEVPQFINILRGEMSLIGPRPYFADELEEKKTEFPHTQELVRQALSVRPGITGEWQVSGRSKINFDQRIEMDAHYAREHNLWYDLRILLKTPWVMLSGKGAV